MQTLRAISVRQPWAELLASGQKTIETRTAGFRIPRDLAGQRIAIHASGTLDPDWRGSQRYRAAAVEILRVQIRQRTGKRVTLPDDLDDLPRLAVVATARVDAVRRLNGLIDSAAALCRCEGLQGIVLSDVVRVDPPLPLSGQQGIFLVPAAAILQRSTRPLPFPKEATE